MRRKMFREELMRADLMMYKENKLEVSRLIDDHGMVNICEYDSRIFINVVLDLYEKHRGYFNNNLKFINKRLLENCLDDIHGILHNNYLHEIGLRNIMSNVIFDLLEFNLYDSKYNKEIYIKLIRMCFRFNEIRSADILDKCMMEYGYINVLRDITRVYSEQYKSVNITEIVPDDIKRIDKLIVEGLIKGIYLYDTVDMSILMSIMDLPTELLDDEIYGELITSCRNISDLVLGLNLDDDKHIKLMEAVCVIIEDNVVYYRDKIVNYNDVELTDDKTANYRTLKIKDVTSYEKIMYDNAKAMLKEISYILSDEEIEQILNRCKPSFDDYSHLTLLYRNVIMEVIHQTNLYFEYRTEEKKHKGSLDTMRWKLVGEKYFGYEESYINVSLNGKPVCKVNANIQVQNTDIIHSLLDRLNFGTVTDQISRYILLIEFIGYVTDDDVDQDKVVRLYNKIKEYMGGRI